MLSYAYSWFSGAQAPVAQAPQVEEGEEFEIIARPGNPIARIFEEYPSIPPGGPEISSDPIAAVPQLIPAFEAKKNHTKRKKLNKEEKKARRHLQGMFPKGYQLR